MATICDGCLEEVNAAEVCDACGMSTCPHCYADSDIEVGPGFATAGGLCPDHRHECADCEAVGDDTEIEPCTECPKRVCDDCSDRCRVCDDTVCFNCIDNAEGYACADCGAVTCATHLPPACVSPVCAGDGRVCGCGDGGVTCPGENCSSVWCSPDCVGDAVHDQLGVSECSACGGIACDDHIGECSGCRGALYCPRCYGVCADCGDPMCFEHTVGMRCLVCATESAAVNDVAMQVDNIAVH